MIDFQNKIKFLHKEIYKDINLLTKAFYPSKSPSKKDIRSRKNTIKKWLKNEVFAPRKFHNEYHKYPISQYLPFHLFSDLTVKEFKKEFVLNQEETKIEILSLENYQYIYYYNEDSENLTYFKVSYQKNNTIKLSTTYTYAQKIIYFGTVEKNQNAILHFIVSNEYERMFFSFSELDFKKNYEVYGLCLSKDFTLKHPKASMVLLSNEKLDKQKENVFKSKINRTNIILADNSKRNEEESFLNNLSIKLRSLNSSLDSYSSKNIFLNLFLEEFNLLYKRFDSFEKKDEFFIHSLIKNLYIILDSLNKTDTKQNLKIIVTTHPQIET